MVVNHEVLVDGHLSPKFALLRCLDREGAGRDGHVCGVLGLVLVEITTKTPMSGGRETVPHGTGGERAGHLIDEGIRVGPGARDA
jgi:hypothetical protein